MFGGTFLKNEEKFIEHTNKNLFRTLQRFFIPSRASRVYFHSAVCSEHVFIFKFCIMGNHATCTLVEQQEAHGPHRSPEKTVQINKHIRFYDRVDEEKENKTQFSF